MYLGTDDAYAGLPLKTPLQARARRGTGLTGADIAFLAISAVATAYLSIAAHDLALTRLGVPYPYEQGVPHAVRLVDQAIRLGALVALCRCAAGVLRSRSALTAALITGVLNAALCESLRIVIIDDAIYGGGWGGHLLYSLTDHLPSGLLNFYQGAAAALIARAWPRSVSAPLAVAVIAAAIVGIEASPFLKAAMSQLQVWLKLPAPTPLYSMPFNFHMYKYIYATFLEPTVGCLLLAAMVLPSLPGGRARRVALFVLLVLVARGRVSSLLLNAFWLKYPLPLSLAAEGQFFVETLILATLTGLSCDLVRSRVIQRATTAPVGGRSA